MKTSFSKFDVAEHLRTPEEMALYLDAWFDGGNDESGQKATLFYARMDGVAWVSSPSKKFGNMKKQV